MKIRAVIHPLHPRAVFRISRAQRTEVRNVFLRVEAEGVYGYGEASPNAFYGETAEDVHAKLSGLGRWIETAAVRDVGDMERLWQEGWPLVRPSRAAQCALDLALWDWLGRRVGKSVAELAFGESPRAIPSFCTIGISDPRELAAKVEELRTAPFIKIKADATGSVDAVRFVRSRTKSRLAVDANCAWGKLEIAPLAETLAGLGTAFIEQPLPPEQDDQMLGVHAASAIPIFADESCVSSDDVDRMPGRFSGFNIKLVKCGGITPALEMLKQGRALGLRTMVGCMLESSALIAAGAVIAQRTDYADLDGAWLLSDDPFRGWKFNDGTLGPPEGAGLGIEPVDSLFAD